MCLLGLLEASCERLCSSLSWESARIFQGLCQSMERLAWELEEVEQSPCPSGPSGTHSSPCPACLFPREPLFLPSSTGRRDGWCYSSPLALDSSRSQDVASWERFGFCPSLLGCFCCLLPPVGLSVSAQDSVLCAGSSQHCVGSLALLFIICLFGAVSTWRMLPAPKSLPCCPTRRICLLCR